MQNGDEMTYKISQVLFILQNDSAKIAPVQVAEEVTKKTMNGNEVTYIVKHVNSKGESSLVDLSKVKGEIFTSPEKLKKVLIARVSASMVQIVANAVEKAKLDFNSEGNVETLETSEGVRQELNRSLDEVSTEIDENGYMNVEIDGKVRRVKVNL